MPMNNWMTELYNLIAPGTGGPGVLGINTAFGDRLLHQLVIPGTHDAGCYLNHHNPVSYMSQTQDLTIAQQLDHGIRYLDLRPARYWAITRRRWEYWTYHGPSNTNLPTYYGGRLDTAAGILQEIAQFMHDHRGDQELVILNFSHYRGFDQNVHADFINLIQDYLWDFLVPHTQNGINIGATTYNNLLIEPEDTPIPDRPRDAPASLPAAPHGGYGAGPRSRVLVVYDGALDQDREPIPLAGNASIVRKHGFWILDPKYPAAGIGAGALYPGPNTLKLFDQYAGSGNLDTMRTDQLTKLTYRAGLPYTRAPWAPAANWNANAVSGVANTMHLFSWTLTPQPKSPVNVARETTNPALAPLFNRPQIAPSWPTIGRRMYDPQLDPMMNIIYVDVPNSHQRASLGQWNNYDMPVALSMYLNRYIAVAPWDDWANW